MKSTLKTKKHIKMEKTSNQKSGRPITFSTAMVKSILLGNKTETRPIVNPQPYVDEKNHLIQSGVNYGKSQSDVPALWNFSAAKNPFKNGMNLWVQEPFRVVGWDFESETVTIEYGDYVRMDFDIYDPIHPNEVTSNWILNHVQKLESLGFIKMPDNYDFDRDGEDVPFDQVRPFLWQSAKSMPRVFSRLNLRVVDSGVEILQSITKDSIFNEGIRCASRYIGADDMRGMLYSFMDDPRNFDTPHIAFRHLWDSIHGVNSWHSNPWVWCVKFVKHEITD